MLTTCSSTNCNVQFAQDAQACPVCGASNQNVVTEHVDAEFASSELRRRILIGVVSGICLAGYALSTFRTLAGGVWILLPFSLALLYICFRVFRAAVDNAPPDRID